MPVSDQWYSALSQKLGVTPDQKTLGFFRAWGTVENVNPAYNNPFGIMDNGKPAQYATAEEGQAATASLLNRRYQYIPISLKRGQPDAAISVLVQSQWNGNGHYGAKASRGSGLRDFRTSSVYRVWKQQGGAPTIAGGGIAGDTSPVANVLSGVNDLGKLTSTVSSKDFWVRTGFAAAGVAFTIVGLAVLIGKQSQVLSGASKLVAGFATNKGKTAGQVAQAVSS